jgi:hypothetical protein
MATRAEQFKSDEQRTPKKKIAAEPKTKITAKSEKRATEQDRVKPGSAGEITGEVAESSAKRRFERQK